MKHYVILRYNSEYKCWDFYSYLKIRKQAVEYLKHLKNIFPDDNFKKVSFDDKD